MMMSMTKRDEGADLGEPRLLIDSQLSMENFDSPPLSEGLTTSQSEIDTFDSPSASEFATESRVDRHYIHTTTTADVAIPSKSPLPMRTGTRFVFLRLDPCSMAQWYKLKDSELRLVLLFGG